MAFDTTIETYNAYAATLTEMTNAEFVADAYAKLLGLEGDFVNSAARIDYWVAKLDAGTLTKETFAAQFLTEASTTQGELLTAEDFAYNQTVTAAIELTDATNTSLDAIATTISDSGAVQPELPEDVSATTAAIMDLQAANTAKADFLEALGMTEAEVGDMIDETVAAPASAVTAFNDDALTSVDLTSTSTKSQQNSAYDVAVANADAILVQLLLMWVLRRQI